MPRVTMQMEEQLSDARSDEAAYRLRLDNLGAKAITLIGLTPRIPEGVQLVQIKDSSAEAVKTRHEALSEELTELLQNHLMIAVKEVRDKMIQIDKEHLKEVLEDLQTIWKAYFKMFTGMMQRQNERRRLSRSAMFFKISGKADADIALGKWFGKQDQSNGLEQLFRAKCQQLEALEATMGADASSRAIATVEPDSFFATTYVLRFARSAITPRKFNFSVEASFLEGELPKVHLDSASTTVVISPRPYVLSIIAMFSAVLGVSLKFSLDSHDLSGLTGFFKGLGTTLITGPGITAVILALVIFNIYEYTGLGGKIKMSVGWRTALLIGVLCGLFSDRMVTALKVLVGA